MNVIKNATQILILLNGSYLRDGKGRTETTPPPPPRPIVPLFTYIIILFEKRQGTYLCRMRRSIYTGRL